MSIIGITICGNEKNHRCMLKKKSCAIIKKKIQPKQKTMVRSITSNLTK